MTARLVLLVVLGCSVPSLALAQTYTITDLGTLGGNYSFAWAVNGVAQVTGSSALAAGGSRAFFWQNGTMRQLTSPYAGDSLGRAINELGQVAGNAPGLNEPWHFNTACRWDADGTYRDIGTLPTGLSSEAFGINDLGEVVGWSDTNAGTGPIRAFIWLPSSNYGLSAGIHDLGDLGEGTAYANGINNKGQVVGQALALNPLRWRGFLWENGAIKIISEDIHEATDINNLTQVCGTGTGSVWAILWDSTTGTRNLGTVPGYDRSLAHVLNDVAQVVGPEPTTSDYGPPALWQDDGLGMRDLNGHLPSGSGWQLTRIGGIGNGGHIVGYGQHNGLTRGFILTPQPDPTIKGRVVFEDKRTPVPYTRVQLFSHPSHSSSRFAWVQPDGSYSLDTSGLGSGYYDIVAISVIPNGYWHPDSGQTNVAYQPYDMSPSADIFIDSYGVVSPAVCNFQFNWPVIMLHGILLTQLYKCSGFGPDHFSTIQPYLASSRTVALENPRPALIPLVLNMSRDCSRTLYENYATVLYDIHRIMQTIYPGWDLKFRFLCYSQGGLVLRLLLDTPYGMRYEIAERAAGAVMLATPNDGTCVADNPVNLALKPWIAPLGTTAMDSFNLNHNYIATPGHPGASVPMFLLAGTDFRWYSYWNLATWCLYPYGKDGSDNIVPVYSVFEIGRLGYNVAAELFTEDNHGDIINDANVLPILHYWLTP